MEEMKEAVSTAPEGEAKTEVKPSVANDSAELARLAAELESVKAELGKAKNVISRTNSEAAEYKRQLREKQTEAEKAEADRLEAERKREEELEALRAEVKASKRERTTANYSKSLLGAGFDAETADLIANHLPDEMGEEFFSSLKAFNDRQHEKYVMENYGKQPGLSVGQPPKGITPEEEEQRKMEKYIGLTY